MGCNHNKNKGHADVKICMALINFTASSVALSG
jgi:hypothetical protein